jgi:glycosyltransferase involved in cell wall biosynthesis
VSAPRVSILVPVFNRRDLLREAVLSALGQTVDDIEVIICDNDSTDGTWSVCEELAALDSRVRTFRNKENLGPVRNWKRCLDEARGIYGKFLFSDDLMEGEFVERTLSIMRSDVGFVFTKIEIGPARKQGWPALCWQPADGVYRSAEFVADALYGRRVPVSPSAAIFRLRDLRDNFVINPSGSKLDFSRLGAGTDMLFFLLTAHAYANVGYVAEQLAFFRSHEGSITANETTRNEVRLAYDRPRIWFASRYAGSSDAYRMLARAWLNLMGAERRWVSPRRVAAESGWGGFSAINPMFSLAVAWELARHHYWKVFRKPRK